MYGIIIKFCAHVLLIISIINNDCLWYLTDAFVVAPKI